MPAGTWAFLHETVLYEYMMHRFNENQLRMLHIINNGVRNLKERWVRVVDLQNITNTRFPDIDGLTIKGDSKGERPAEVKFTTSMFDYHRSKYHVESYRQFVEKHGCIVSLKHDMLPSGILDTHLVDVFQLDEVDFISFAKENFIRFLNRQIKSHSYKKVWIMIQSKNFYQGSDNVWAASESGRWCPTDNLTVFDLSVGDTIIFIKTKGSSKQNVNKYWSRYQMVYDKWFLSDVLIAEVTSPIQDRKEYCDIHGWEVSLPLWYDETEIGRTDPRITKRKPGIRWNRVFEFSTKVELNNLDIPLCQLNNFLPEFVHAAVDVYTGRGSREISAHLYTALLEYLVGYENDVKQNLLSSVPDLSQISLFESKTPIQ